LGKIWGRKENKMWRGGTGGPAVGEIGLVVKTEEMSTRERKQGRGGERRGGRDSDASGTRRNRAEKEEK